MGEGLSEASILDLAARGDRDALAIFRDSFLEEANEAASVLPAADLWAQAEICAHLTAAHGHPIDVLTLALVLLVRAQQAEDAGHEPHADLLRQRALSGMAEVAASGDVNAISAMVASIEMQADAGDTEATALLEQVIRALDKDMAARVLGLAREAREEMEGARG